MTNSKTTRRTPITDRADRADQRVRMIEETVLMIRGEWPAVALGLCEAVNRASGLVFAPPAALEDAIGETAAEASRLVEDLYGHAAALEVKRLAAVDPVPTAHRSARRPRLRGHRPRSALAHRV
jgi:hypothetical protein